MRTAVFTIVSPNYRHYARVLMASVEGREPDWERFVLIVGGEAAEPGEVSVEALSLPAARRLFFRYTILELNTAVKPWMFAHLFARGFDRVVYLDPDIVVFSPLVELDGSPFITLTPHLTGFIGGDGHPSERSILQAGTYNLGFLSIQRNAQVDAFLDWWKAKLEFDCVVEVERGLFVDQKWIDLVPGLFSDVTILRHDGYNVAYWNLRQRAVREEHGAITVNGQPLRFFHFSGVDPALRRLVSKYDTLRIDDVGAAGPLIERYHAALREAGHEAQRTARYAFGTFNDGTPIPDAARYAYRNSDELQRACGDDPFAHPELFTGFRDPKKRDPRLARMTAHAYRVLSSARPLVKLLPRSLRTRARTALLGPHTVPPVAMSAMNDDVTLPAGVNIVGYVTRDTGMGEAARGIKASCDAAGVRADFVDLDASPSGKRTIRYPISIHHVNADQVPVIQAQIPEVFAASTYNIGVWHWELPEFPDLWLSSAAPFDEIWASSAFIQSAVSRKVTIPVVHLPHGVEVRELEPCAPEDLGVPRGRFTFLCMFDLRSVVQRKNPYGAIEAFRRAFAHDSSAALLIKVSHADDHRDDYDDLIAHVRDMPNVHLSDRMLSRARVNGLIAGCDAVLSLHRSEGFGLILAEAMALGKPVVATAWSGNMDFMNAGNSCPVNYDLVTLDRDYGPYKAGQQWAEPDLDHAAHLMRRLVGDAAYRTQIGARAAATIGDQFSYAAAGERYRARLQFLRAK